MLKTYLKDNHISMYKLSNTSGVPYEEPIIAVKSEATRSIRILGLWKLEELLAKIELKNAYEKIVSQKMSES